MILKFLHHQLIQLNFYNDRLLKLAYKYYLYSMNS